MTHKIEPDLEMQIYRNNINDLQKQLQEAYQRNLQLRTKLTELETILDSKVKDLNIIKTDSTLTEEFTNDTLSIRA